MSEEKAFEAFEKKVIDQVEKEYRLCLRVLRPKIDEWLFRLKVYNNQKKQKKAVGDPLLFTVFQTIFASLYDDGLNSEWLPREEGDIDVTENLNLLSQFDNEEMQKDELDYEWDWDTMFFGRGVVCMMEFCFEKKCPVPEVWSPLVLLRDPEARSVNGNMNGKGGCRFIGRETNQLIWQLKEHPAYFNLEGLKTGKTDQTSLYEKKERARREALGLADTTGQEIEVGDNTFIRTVQWFTFIDGERFFVELAENMSRLIRFQKLEDQSEWPLIDRPLFPVAGDWDGVSIPDLVEDKQRARAVLINAGLETAKANSAPMYLFDVNRIKRRDQLNFEANKFVPVDGNPRDAAVPMMRDQIKTEAQYIFNVLDESVQRALATPELQQGATPRRTRTLGELELMSAKVDTRYSLAAKIFGWSEKKFWKKWYFLYKQYFPEGVVEKVIRLQGVFGPEFRKLTRENIISKVDPDVRIESEAIARAHKALDRSILSEFMMFGTQIPGYNIRYTLRELGRLSGYSKGKIDQMLPQSYDEMTAEKENQMINDGKNPRVLLQDEHMVHIAIHAKANDTPELEKHIKSHELAIRIVHEHPELFDPALIGEGLPSPVEPPGIPSPPKPSGNEQRSRSGVTIPQSYGQGTPGGTPDI